MNLSLLLSEAASRSASDLHLKVGNPPILRIDGKLVRMDAPSLTPEDCDAALDDILTEQQKEAFLSAKELDVPHILDNVSRFRVNVSREKGATRIVCRLIPLRIPTIEELALPAVLKDLVKHQYGLVLVTGATGMGKSTTLAAMVHEINRQLPSHIVTIEDPIEFVHEDVEGIVTQRQLRVDTNSFANALRTVLRQDPDTILVGEMRDAETVQSAITAAETGHLVMSTIQTNDAVETIHRILDFFPDSKQRLVRTQFSSSLRAVISQRLIPRREGAGRVAACEVMIATKLIRDIIRSGNDIDRIPKLMEEGKGVYGSQTFDQALHDLWDAEAISQRTALEYATNPQDLSLRFRGFKPGKLMKV
jgi:twitching motility protein PilT